MGEYLFQYRREQRTEFTIIAETLRDAESMAEGYVQGLSLSSPDDSSDDPGELELLEGPCLLP